MTDVTEWWARESEAIRRWQPWKRSTGPKAAKGKAASAMNRYSGGRTLLRDQDRLLAVLAEQAD